MDNNWLETTSTMVTHLTDAQSTPDKTARRLHYAVAALNGMALLPNAVRTVRQFFASHPGIPGSMPGPGGY